MIPLPRTHTLGDFRDAIERYAVYPDAGAATDRARNVVTLGLFNSMVGDISAVYENVINDGQGFTEEMLAQLKDDMGNALWYITRSIVEFSTASAGLLWGQDLSEMHKPIHIDNPAHAWLSVPRVVVQSDFHSLHDAQLLLRALAYAAARHGWTLQDVAWANLRKLISREEAAGAGTLVSAGAAL